MTRTFHPLFTLLGMATLGILSGPAIAQETFIPPQQHPTDRYESSWGKNPFILKTAPVVEERKSFAKDLVLQNAFQLPGGDVTVVVANTKTKETYRLNTREPASNGMKIRSVMLKDPRKDSYVEVEQNGESAVLRYDETFRKQMLASKSTHGNGKHGATGAGGADGSGQPIVNANGEPMTHANPTAPAQHATPGSPVIRPPLPQRPNPDVIPVNSEPASIRPPGPGPGPQRVLPVPQRGTPTPGRRRFFTAPAPASPPETAQVTP